MTPGLDAPERRGHESANGGGGAPDCRLGRDRRLTRTSAFREAYDQGNRFFGRYVILFLRSSADADLRLGVVAGKRTLRRSVDRSRARRLMREAYRLNRHRLCGPYDIVLVARYPILSASRPDVERELVGILTRAGLIAERAGA